MTRKIVAIGGGGNGRPYDGVTPSPYEIKKIDEEIVRLSNKSNPNVLFLAQAQPIERQFLNYEVIKKNYGALGCNVRYLDNNDLLDKEKTTEYFAWSDIIFETGGDTMTMIDIWKKTGVDKLLYDAWIQGKVLSGVSAGANCWFKECSTDSIRIQKNDFTLPLTKCDCLGFINAFYTPHCDSEGREESTIDLLKNSPLTGILISNCCALEIVDNKYRLITCDTSLQKIDKAYGLKIYYKNGVLHRKYIDDSDSFKDLDDLLRQE